MKTLINLLLLIVVGINLCSCAIDLLPDVPGIKLPMPITSYAATPIDCTNKYGPMCDGDCRTYAVCGGMKDPIHKAICGDVDGGTPYCLNNRCTSIPDPNNAQCSLGTTFTCTSDGIFPDPVDCTVYYVCEDKGKAPDTFKCPAGYCFNSEAKLCRQYNNPSSHFKLDCSKNKNEFIPYKPNPAYFAFCGVPILMFKCVDDENFIFDTKITNCKFNCKQAGDFIDRVDCQKYISCYRSGGEWKSIELSCGPNYYFDKDKKSCVRGTCTPEIVTTGNPPPSSQSPS